MSETRIGPAIVVLETDAARLEATAETLPVPVLPPLHPFRLAALGTAILLGGLFLLLLAGLVIDQFARAPLLGWATIAVAAAGVGLIAAALWRGLRSLRQLRHVDRLRADLANPATTRAAALSWLKSIAASPQSVRAVETADSADEIRRILRAGPRATIELQVTALAKRAAWQVAGMTAAMPSPAIEMLIVLWRSWQLVLDIAALHGLRPSGLGALILLRRTLLSAASVGVANAGVTSAVTGILQDPDLHRVVGNGLSLLSGGVLPGDLPASLMARLAGDAAAASVAAQRMITLARAAATACSPVDE